MVCLCGRTISNNIAILLDDNSRTLSSESWERFPIAELYEDIYAYNTFRSMIISLRHPEANSAVKLLRSQFAGFLDDVTMHTDEEEELADFLTAEGVLLRPDVKRPRYHMASPLVDGLIRTRVIPAQFPNAPTTTPPFRSNGTTLRVLDALIESLKVFDKDLIRLACSRSYKSSLVKVGGLSDVSVPRESVYDTELMRILSNWLQKQYGWTVTGQWHLQTTLGEHKYTDIVIKKDENLPIVLELLATGDTSFVRSQIEKTSRYKTLLSANEAWVIHFTCEDDYHPVWQSDAELDSGVNVAHFSHDLGFTRVRMMARWKDDAGILQEDSCELDM
jgi:hypothetical protein